MFSSDWQKVAFSIGALVVLMAIVCFGAAALGLTDLLIWKTGYLLAVAFAFYVFAVIIAFALNRLYRKSYDMKEEPVELRNAISGEEKWDTICPNNKKLTTKQKIVMYEWEFLLNSLIHPRSIFSRINEYISPGRRMLDCDIHYEVKAPSNYGLHIMGVQDYRTKNKSGKEGPSSLCKLLIPVAFQERGGLTISQQIYGSSGVNLPIVKQKYFTDNFISMINSYLELMEVGTLEEQTIRNLSSYLGNIRRNTDTQIPEDVCKELLEKLGDDGKSRNFVRNVLRTLVGLKDVIPICVSLHVVAEEEDSTDAADNNSGVPRIFKLSVREKREMVEKPINIIPNRSRSQLTGIINGILRLSAHRGDTVYYNLSNAGRTTSYHLHVEGPENTYYARGSLVRERADDQRRSFAEQVEMQKRCGQRNAHIYIRSGHRMVNVAFMFRFRKAPLDSYHIMFVATLLCTAVLSVCLTSFLRDCDGSQNLSAVSTLLAVVSAAGSWIYGRAWDGREESFGIMVAVVATVSCSLAGIVLSGALGGYLKETLSYTHVLAAWILLSSVMACVTALIGYAALRHGSVYRYLLSKDPSKRQGSLYDSLNSDGNPSDWIIDGSSIADETQDGMRCDTPQGRYVANDFRLWVRSSRRFERRYDAESYKP